jgi:hypothetical protein
MKTLLLPLTLALATSVSMAATPASPESVKLRQECAEQVKTLRFEQAKTPAMRQLLSDAYASRGGLVECSNDQYAKFRLSVDPVRIQAAYPTAAGRAKAGAKGS